MSEFHRINLYPWRDRRDKELRKGFLVQLGVAAAVGLLLSAINGALIAGFQQQQTQRNDLLKAQMAKYDKEIVRGNEIRGDIAALRERQRAVERLQGGRNLPVMLLGDLSRLLPEGVAMTSLHQKGDSVEIRGVAQSNERISQLMGALKEQGRALMDVKLESAVAFTYGASAREKVDAMEFFITARVGNVAEAREAEKVAAAASSALADRLQAAVDQALEASSPGR